MKRCRAKLNLAVIALVASLSVVSAEKASEPPTPGRITFGGHGNNTRERGMTDMLVTLWGTKDTLLFFNPRFSFDDGNVEELNAGIGGRTEVLRKQALLGASLFYDNRWSGSNNHFSQVGGGVELLSLWYDARANYYLPERKRELVSEVETTESATDSRTQRGTPYMEGGRQFQTRTVTTETTQTSRWWEQYESALEGFDAEFGGRIPFLMDLATTRLFVGYQSFENPFGPDLDGWKGRAEVRFGEGLILDFEIFENEVLNQGDFLVGLRLHMPFSLGNLLQGKNPFEGAADSFVTRPPTLTDRLSEQIVREMDILLVRSSIRENPSRRSTMTEQNRSTYTDELAVVVMPPPPPPPPEEEEEEEEEPDQI